MPRTLTPDYSHLPDRDVYGPCSVISAQEMKTVNAWYVRLREAAGLTVGHGQVPHPNAPDTVLRASGRWVERQRAAGRDGTLTPSQVGMLNSLLPGWSKTTLDAIFEDNVVALAVFFDTHGRYPSAAEDVRLYEWVEDQLARLRHGTLLPERVLMLEQMTPGLTGGVAESKWVNESLTVAEFWNTHNRLPSRKTDDAAERKCGQWLHNQRTRLNDRNGTLRARATALDTLIPGWRGRNHTTV